jgi:two-component system, NarL family, response regulator YdfI
VIRVFIVAASSFARAGLQSLFEGKDVEVVGSAPNLDSLGDQGSDAGADIILVEASAEQLEVVIDSLTSSELASEANVVLLSDDSEPRGFAEAMRAGVRAFLPGDLPRDQLLVALEAVAAGLVVLHPAEVDAMFPATDPVPRALPELAEPLTPREIEVLQMLASGLGNKEIATRLEISEHTVKFHVASILGRLGAGSRTEAVSLGFRRGLVLL